MSAPAGRRSFLGRRVYVLYRNHGTHGNGRGCGEFCGGGGPGSDLLCLQRCGQRGRHHGRQRVGGRQPGKGQGVRHPAEEYFICHRVCLHAGGLCPDAAGDANGHSDRRSPELSDRHDDHHGRLYDRPQCQHGDNQRCSGRRRGYSVRYVFPGGVHVGRRDSLGAAGRLCVPLAGAAGVCLYLPG